MTSYLTEKLIKLRGFDRQYRRPQNCPFQTSFTQRTEQFTEGIHSFLSLPVDTKMASFQGTQPSSNSFSRWTSYDKYDILLFKYHSLLHILRFPSFFSDNIMADVASKQQTTALFLSTIVRRTRRHTELTKKKLTMGNLCCAREHSVHFFVQDFYTVKRHSLT